MIESTRTERIRRQIEHVYGRLDEPFFGFTWSALEIRPYEELAARLAARFQAQDDTEVNDDVSFGLCLRLPDGPRVLRLSMVGPYALLLRTAQAPAVVVEPGLAGSDEERELVGQLVQRGLELLDRTTLDARVPLALAKTPPEECRFYQALFVDSDVVPWESAPPAGA
jgi:hypothetical protein